MTTPLANVVDVCLVLRARRAARRITRFYDRELAIAGLDSSQFNILCVIGSAAPVALTEVAATLDLDPSTLSRMTKTLENKGLIAIDGGRGRGGLTLWLTPRGEETMNIALEAWKRAQTAFAGGIGEAQLGQALEMFDRIEGATPTA